MHIRKATPNALIYGSITLTWRGSANIRWIHILQPQLFSECSKYSVDISFEDVIYFSLSRFLSPPPLSFSEVVSVTFFFFILLFFFFDDWRLASFISVLKSMKASDHWEYILSNREERERKTDPPAQCGNIWWFWPPSEVWCFSVLRWHGHLWHLGAPERDVLACLLAFIVISGLIAVLLLLQGLTRNEPRKQNLTFPHALGSSEHDYDVPHWPTSFCSSLTISDLCLCEALGPTSWLS